MLQNPKRSGGAQDAAAVMWPDPPARERAVALAREIVRWMLLKRDGALDRPDRQRVQIELPTAVKDVLHVAARDASMSVARLIEGVVVRWAEERYPALRRRS